MTVKTLLIAASYTLFILALLFTWLSPFVSAQGDWKQSNVNPFHPKDMTAQERQQWDAKLKKINDALEEVSDPNKYEKGKYECNNFSDFTARQLAAKCFTVKRAKTMQFRSADNATSEHHWVFIVTKVGDKELWIPIECTPPEGERQKGEEWESPQLAGKYRTEGDVWPRVACDEEYRDPSTDQPKPEDKFDERYFGNIQIKDAPKPEGCTDPLAALERTIPLAIVARDALTSEPLSLPLEIYNSDGTIATTVITASDGTADTELPAGAYYVKAKLNVLWFHVPAYTSPIIVLDRPYELNIMIFTLVPVRFVPLASYVILGILIAAGLYRLAKLAVL